MDLASGEWSVSVEVTFTEHGNDARGKQRLFLVHRRHFARSKYIGARNRYRSDESRSLHNDLVRQADERSRLHKLSRFQDNIAELQVDFLRSVRSLCHALLISTLTLKTTGGGEVVAGHRPVPIVDTTFRTPSRILDSDG